MSEFVNNHRTLQQVVCLLICVCAWRGPVPVLHDHRALTTDRVLQNRHSQAFHEGRQIAEIEGLHWHLGFPEDVTGDQYPVRDEGTSELPLFACAAAAVFVEFAEAQSMQFALRVDTEDFHSAHVNSTEMYPQRTTTPRSFLQTLLSEIPLSSVTGVCLV